MTTWTPDRPTKPGKYWLSLPKHIRAELDAMVGYKTPPCFVVLLDLDRIESLHINCAIESVAFQDWTAGAQWLPYVEPPDPFAEPVEPKSQQTLSITTEERKTLSSALHTMAGSLRKLAKTNPSDAHGAIAEADRMDALNARICEVRGFTPDETSRAKPSRAAGVGDPSS